MGIFDGLRKLFTNNIEQVRLMTESGNRYYSFNGRVYESDVVRACMRPKVKAVGKLVGKHIREKIENDGKNIEVNPVFNIRHLLEEPNPIMSGQMLQEKMATQLILNNNAFALINRDTMGNPMAIYPIIPQSVEAKYRDGNLYLKFSLPNNKDYEFLYSDIIHLRQDYNENDIFGTPLAPSLIPLLEVVSITDQGIMNAIKNSSVVRWLLKFSNSMRPDDLREQATQFSESFLEGNSKGVAAVDSKADAKQITPTDYVPNAAQMDRTTQRIYALFNTNPKIVNSAWSEEEYTAYFDAEIEPVLCQFAHEYTRKLFTLRERAFGNKIVFEASAWDSASIKTKLNLLQMVDRGALTPNEWRATMNLAPVKGGDEPIRRLDTATVKEESTDEN